MHWYYARDGQSHGPVDDQELKRLAATGELRPDDLVWTETMGDQWAPASSVQNLFPPGVGTAGSGGIPRPENERGKTPNRELTRRARESLRGHWGLAIGAWVLMQVILIGASMVPVIGGFTGLILTGPLTVGYCALFLSLVRGRGTEIGQLFSGFSKFGTAFGTYFLVLLFVFLWSLLLIIPGLIAAYAYSMAYFIVADNPSVGALEAIRRSKTMMRGHKAKLFLLHLRFVGWALLCLLTLGIGFLWLVPYMQASFTHFYEDVRA